MNNQYTYIEKHPIRLTFLSKSLKHSYVVRFCLESYYHNQITIFLVKKMLQNHAVLHNTNLSIHVYFLYYYLRFFI